MFCIAQFSRNLYLLQIGSKREKRVAELILEVVNNERTVSGVSTFELKVDSKRWEIQNVMKRTSSKPCDILPL